ncbi:hypothetical protein CFIMG_000848RA [Ceratocystis fimbriata CBS 114723]|uniref:HAUS augmin-like complex subunit 3 N-terminal domain-containing protein n=1 Tax=Ceratocystis fimbriata CBS 114723 TaxID=1035309 RepID=A0A2C5X808_9PEZI|nr:hypothetical protein CFIMG_000848RA [Ceratocystis fimbriata CBS 114723]
MDLPTLERISRDYSLGLGNSRLQAMLEDDLFASWAELHLTPDNLLTTDELAAYSALQASGTVDRLAASEDLSAPGLAVFSDSELRAAIQMLTASTAQLTQHTRALQAQESSLARLSSVQSTRDASRSRLADAHLARRAAAMAEAEARLREAQDHVAEKVADARMDVEQASSEAARLACSIGEADNKVLQGMEKLARELVGGEEREAEKEQELDKLNNEAMRLIKSTVELARTRLDRVYLDGLTSPLAATGFGTDELESTEALQIEVESLYAEILPVAQMAVENSFLEPARSTLLARHTAERQHTTAGLRYTNECFEHLLDRMRRVKHRLETLQAHQATTTLLAEAAEKELSTPITMPALPQSPDNNTPTAPGASPAPTTGRPKISDPATPGPARRRCSPSLTFTAFERALHTLGVKPPDPMAATSKAMADLQILQMLARTTAERSLTVQETSRNAQASFESSAAHHLADSKRDIDTLLGHIKADYPFGDVGLADPGMAESLAWIGREVKEAQERIANVQTSRVIGGEEKDKFVEMWR